jgi:hypothetical protein
MLKINPIIFKNWSIQMTNIINEVDKTIFVDYSFPGMTISRRSALQKHLDQHLKVLNVDDEFGLLTCPDPDCKSVHGLRYYFNSDDFNSSDFDVMQKHLDEVLTDWVNSISSQTFKP